jgi:Domain of unknown function (DUF4911)
MMPDTISICAWIKPAHIALAQALLAGFEGMGILRVNEANTGAVTFWVPPSQLEDFNEFLDDLPNWVEIKRRD